MTRHKIKHEGLTLTVKEWSAKTGIPPTTIYGRRARGLSSNEILSQHHHTTKITLMVNGKKTTYKEMSKASGLSPQCLRSRIRLGWTPEKAIGQPKKENGFADIEPLHLFPARMEGLRLSF